MDACILVRQHHPIMGSTGGATFRRIDRCNVTEIIQAVFQDGCCIITNFTNPETVSRVNEETRPYLDADKPWEVRLSFFDP
jgi:hypothetical protein